MFANILIGTDGSEGSQAAITRGLELAKEHGATVHALFVVDSRPAEPVHQEFSKKVGAKATTIVVGQATQLGVDVVSDVVVGIPSKQILRYAVDHDIDLIVLGGRNRGRLDRLIMSSIVQPVLRSARVPVLVIRESVTTTPRRRASTSTRTETSVG